MMLLLGRLPSSIFDFNSGSDALGPSSCADTPRQPMYANGNRYTHFANLLLGLAERESLWLCEEVGEENAVVERVNRREAPSEHRVVRSLCRL